MQRPWLDQQLSLNDRVDALLAEMTLAEKVGQLNQIRDPDCTPELVRAGMVGSPILASSAWAGNDKQQNLRSAAIDALQAIAVDESRLGIPLLYGRDVIHGHSTVFPIPLGQGATWRPELV